MSPIFQGADGKWYFWDECQLYDYGPYNSYDEARLAMVEYCKQLIGN